jgi:ATP-dependent helicase HrpA
MAESDLRDEVARTDERDFPTRWRQGDQVLSLAYRFEPGATDDGVTAVVPLPLLAQLRPDGFDWQVPGMRDELIAALIRALPKAIRRHVVPAADWAAKFAEELAADGPESLGGTPPKTLREALSARIQRVANQPVTPADFEMDRVPEHLQIAFRAVDERGRAVGSDRDLATLQRRLSDRARTAVSRSLTSAPPRRGGPAGPAAAAPAVPSAAIVERTGLTTWDLDSLPEVVDTKVAGGVVRGYPALVDDGDSVSVRIEASPDAAASHTRAGVRRLLLLSSPTPASYVLEHLTAPEKLALAASPYASARALVEDARRAVADRCIDDGGTAPIRSAADFARIRDDFGRRVVDDLFQAVSLCARILTLHRDVERAVKGQNALTLLAALNDVKAQLAGLVYPGFVSATGSARLAHLPRYLQGALLRVGGLAEAPGRDRQRQTEFERAAALYTEAGGTIPPSREAPASLVHSRWLLEEYRVSLFAQTLGTAEPVSLQRVQKALRE